MESILAVFENIQKHLKIFLESKRENFNRLYFLGDRDLIEAIGKKDSKYVI